MDLQIEPSIEVSSRSVKTELHAAAAVVTQPPTESPVTNTLLSADLSSAEFEEMQRLEQTLEKKEHELH
eukprot:SAG31_NODE_40116_length_283_cov_0.826087_1_plen_68_part_10